MSEFEYGFTDEFYDGSAYDEGRSDAIKEVLEIIDGERVTLREPKSTLEEYNAYNKGRDEMRTVIYKKVLALKGEQG